MEETRPVRTRALMLKLPDRRRLFTTEENLKTLEEFARVFHAEVSLVEVRDPDLLDADGLAREVCDPKPHDRRHVRVLKRIHPPLRRERTKLRREAKEIRSYISQRLVKSGSISMAELHDKFGDLNLSASCLCNHIAWVRRELEKSGTCLSRERRGVYLIKNPGLAYANPN